MVKNNKNYNLLFGKTPKQFGEAKLPYSIFFKKNVLFSYGR